MLHATEYIHVDITGLQGHWARTVSLYPSHATLGLLYIAELETPLGKLLYRIFEFDLLKRIIVAIRAVTLITS